MALIELERLITRRAFLRSSSVLGVGSTAFNSLLADEKVKEESNNSSVSSSHFAPTAKSVIFLHMVGAPSQLDLFDPKPKLKEYHGKPAPDEFIEGNVRDAAQLVQGKVAGLSISAPSGDPTAGTQIRLRGIATLNGSSAPLILVDGVPGSLQTVAPEDIASIDVLKDGSATAIYGTRGTNGVIIITTKGAGNNMQPTIEYTGNVSFQSISNKLDFLNASELRDKYDEGYSFTGANLQDYGSDTDWLDEITQNSISTIQHLIVSNTTGINGALSLGGNLDQATTMNISGDLIIDNNILI